MDLSTVDVSFPRFYCNGSEMTLATLKWYLRETRGLIKPLMIVTALFNYLMRPDFVREILKWISNLPPVTNDMIELTRENWGGRRIVMPENMNPYLARSLQLIIEHPPCSALVQSALSDQSCNIDLFYMYHHYRPHQEWSASCWNWMLPSSKRAIRAWLYLLRGSFELPLELVEEVVNWLRLNQFEGRTGDMDREMIDVLF